MLQIFQALFSPIHNWLNRYVVADNWFYAGTGTAGVGFGLDSLLPNSLAFSVQNASLIDRLVNDPVPYATASITIVIGLLSAYHKVTKIRNENELHDIDVEVRRKDLNR